MSLSEQWLLPQQNVHDMADFSCRRLARYEDAEARLSNALRMQTGPTGQQAAADIAQRFVSALEVSSPRYLVHIVDLLSVRRCTACMHATC